MTKRIITIIALSLYLTNIFAQQRIPMQLEPSGIYTIPCEVNGLKLRFVFDTGASDVHLSLLDAAFMIKNGYIKEEDFIGKDSYSMADGSIAENAIVILKEIKIGNVIIHNVRACISKNMDAALLLGQSAINKIGKYTVDNNYLILQGQNSKEYSPDQLNKLENKLADSFYVRNGEEYNGQTLNGLRHGKGTYTWRNGNKYEGQWLQDRRHGYGTLYYKNGDKYIGNWINDMKDGRGVMITIEGDQYSGEWKENKITGIGSFIMSNGDKYVGEFKDGLREGEGTYSWHSGTKYTGSWKAGMRNGYGTFYYSNGTIKRGYWKDDKLVNPK